MSYLSEMSDFIRNVIPKHAFLLRNGEILKSTIAENNILIITPFIPLIIDNIPVGQFIQKKKLYVFRLSEHFIILGITELQNSVADILFQNISERYASVIKKKFSNPTVKTVKSILKSTIFSMSKESGPEPIAWRPISMKETDILNISMKTMLTLTGEINGANKKMVSMQPFLQYDALGIIYLFQIPFKGARGNAFDSSITLLVNYGDRAIIYEKHNRLEAILEDYSYLFTNKYNEYAGHSSKEQRSVFTKLLEELEDEMDKIQLKINKSDVIMDEMLKSLKKLKEN